MQSRTDSQCLLVITIIVTFFVGSVNAASCTLEDELEGDHNVISDKFSKYLRVTSSSDPTHETYSSSSDEFDFEVKWYKCGGVKYITLRGTDQDKYLDKTGSGGPTTVSDSSSVSSTPDDRLFYYGSHTTYYFWFGESSSSYSAGESGSSSVVYTSIALIRSWYFYPSAIVYSLTGPPSSPSDLAAHSLKAVWFDYYTSPGAAPQDAVILQKSGSTTSYLSIQLASGKMPRQAQTFQSSGKTLEYEDSIRKTYTSCCDTTSKDPTRLVSDARFFLVEKQRNGTKRLKFAINPDYYLAVLTKDDSTELVIAKMTKDFNKSVLRFDLVFADKP